MANFVENYLKDYFYCKCRHTQQKCLLENNGIRKADYFLGKLVTKQTNPSI